MTENLKKFVELNRKKKELKKQLKQLEDELKQLQEDVMEVFEEEGIDKISLDGYTIFLKRTLWAKAKNGDYVYTVTKMKEYGLGDYVQEKFSTQAVSAYVREMEQEDPEEFEKLKEIFDISEVIQPQVKKL